MKTIFKTKILLLLFFVIFSCNNENDEIKAITNKLDVIEKNSDYISRKAIKVGIEKISLKGNNIMINSKSINFNGEKYSVPNLKIYQSNEYFELRQTKNKSIFFNKTNGAIKIKFNGKETEPLDLDHNTFSQSEIRDIAVMLIVAEDIFIENIERIKSSNYQNKCGDWTYVQAGVGRNTADARLTKEVEKVIKDNPNCKRYTEENDTSCLWENNVCIATTELDCKCTNNN